MTNREVKIRSLECVRFIKAGICQCPQKKPTVFENCRVSIINEEIKITSPQKHYLLILYRPLIHLDQW